MIYLDSFLALGLAFVWAWGLTEILLWFYNLDKRGGE